MKEKEIVFETNDNIFPTDCDYILKEINLNQPILITNNGKVNIFIKFAVSL